MGIEHLDRDRWRIKDYDKLEGSSFCDGSFAKTEIEIWDWGFYGGQLNVCETNIEKNGPEGRNIWLPAL